MGFLGGDVVNSGGSTQSLSSSEKRVEDVDLKKVFW